MVEDDLGTVHIVVSFFYKCRSVCSLSQSAAELSHQQSLVQPLIMQCFLSNLTILSVLSRWSHVVSTLLTMTFPPLPSPSVVQKLSPSYCCIPQLDFLKNMWTFCKFSLLQIKLPWALMCRHLWTYAFLSLWDNGEMDIAGSNGSHTLSFLKYRQAIFQSGCTILSPTSHPWKSQFLHYVFYLLCFNAWAVISPLTSW